MQGKGYLDKRRGREGRGENVKIIHHRGAEDKEPIIFGFFLCVLCVSVVNKSILDRRGLYLINGEGYYILDPVFTKGCHNKPVNTQGHPRAWG